MGFGIEKLSEDWWSVIIGVAILALAVIGAISWIPSIGSWRYNPAEALSPYDALILLPLLAFMLSITAIAIAGSKGELRSYLQGFPAVFVLSFIGILIFRQHTISRLGVEYVIWALALGLTVSNLLGLPGWLRPAVRTEFFIKVGLVLLGAEMLFQKLVFVGARGITQALLVVLVVWYFCYLLALKWRLERSLACIMATGVSICGVSAAIAAGGAIKGDPKKISYVVSLILLIAVPMLIVMPFISRVMGLNDAVAGAWIGGTIDTTPAVVAAGALYSLEAMKYATIVKISQNILIGFAAFLLALYWSLRVERKEGERPKIFEIWYRFPKFILGFLSASIIFSLVLTPIMGNEAIGDILTVTKAFRKWLFALAFTCIGLETKLSEWSSLENRRALFVFLAAQTFNVLFTLVIALLLFGGVIE